jgi:hypothetical protein
LLSLQALVEVNLQELRAHDKAYSGLLQKASCVLIDVSEIVQTTDTLPT